MYNNKSTFPGYFTCGLVYNLWSFGGNRLTGLNGLPVILPRVMHISTGSDDRRSMIISLLSVCLSVLHDQGKYELIRLRSMLRLLGPVSESVM
jgi:hypothetical protein